MARATPPTDDPLAALAATVDALGRSLQALERRVAALERSAPSAPAALAGVEPPPHPLPASVASPVGSAAAAPPPATSATATLVPAPDLTRLLTLTGRTLIIFGGGYLLRALTAAGVLAEEVGVLLAFLYALSWLALADRVGARRDTTSAAFLGATAVLLGLPLLWETTVRFRYLGPAACGLAVAALTAAALAVAWRRRLHGLAWAVTLAVPVAALALIAGTRVATPFGADLVLLGLAGIFLCYDREWRGLGWTSALLGDLGALVVLPAVFAQGREPLPALAVGLALCLGYLLSFLDLARRREIGVFVVVQAPFAAFVGYGGAALVAMRVGALAQTLVGVVGVLLAAAAYWIAFVLTPRERRRTLLLASALAVAFTLAGSAILLPPGARAYAWSALAAVSGWQAVRRRRVTLALHGAVYALAAGAASGLLTAAAYAFAAPADKAWPPVGLAALVALAAAALVCTLPVPRPAPFWKPYAELTRTLQLTVLVWGAAAVALHLLLPLVPPLAGAPPGTRDPAILATLRTAVITTAALLLGWLGRSARFREARRLVYPALLLAVLKLVIEDARVGRPATLFVCLALCGVALIVAPRLRRRGSL